MIQNRPARTAFEAYSYKESNRFARNLRKSISKSFKKIIGAYVKRETQRRSQKKPQMCFATPAASLSCSPDVGPSSNGCKSRSILFYKDLEAFTIHQDNV